MSMTFPCRIRCSKYTFDAIHVIDDPNMDYGPTIDFYKALDLKGINTKRLKKKVEDEVVIDYGFDFDIKKIGVDLYDVGFDVFVYPGYKTVEAMIKNYHDLEWWYNDEYVYIYHWYWQDDMVVEDMYWIGPEDEEILNEKGNQFPVVYTEKQSQTQYVNYKPDIRCLEYKKYISEVNRIAKELLKDRTSDLSSYNLNGYDSHFHVASIVYCAIREEYRNSNYNLNTMRHDIIKRIVSLKKSNKNK